MNPLSQFVSGSALRDFFTEEAGQQRRAWLERQGQAIGDAAQYYLGPTGIPTRIGAAAELLNFTDAGDVVAAGEASQALWNDPSVANAANYAAAGAALALPFYSARMGEGLASAADDAVRYFVDEDGAIRVWHGSPHDFDRFSVDKIGTGEGAQAYGHGLYFAENRGVAEAYRDNLLDARIPPLNARMNELAREMSEISTGYRQWRPGQQDRGRALAAEYDALMDARYDMKGRLYEVEIDANPEDFLDWDAPLSAQPGQVREMLSGIYPDDMMGGDIARLMASDARDTAIMRGDNARTSMGASQEAAAQSMRELGIPGIRYLDAGSRGAGDGSRNYVVFDDRLVSILNKYGLAGVAAMTGGQMLGSYGQGVTDDDRNAMQAYLDGL